MSTQNNLVLIAAAAGAGCLGIWAWQNHVKNQQSVKTGVSPKGTAGTAGTMPTTGGASVATPGTSATTASVNTYVANTNTTWNGNPVDDLDSQTYATWDTYMKCYQAGKNKQGYYGWISNLGAGTYWQGADSDQEFRTAYTQLNALNGGTVWSPQLPTPA